MKARAYIYKNRFVGFPKKTDFELIEEELPHLQNGEFLAEAVFISVDPYMRSWAQKLPLNVTMTGTQVAKIIQSRNNQFQIGQFIVGQFGWRTHTISDGKSGRDGFLPPYLLPEFGNLPLSYALGILGQPGNTAYFGLLEICKPKRGETVIVTGAGGAVGSIVGQIAKIHGCTVIGVAGTKEKGNWLTKTLKFDHFINYKTDNIAQKLKEIAPQGIDCFFDNVGGEICSIIVHHMNPNGRIALCGSISGYNAVTMEKITPFQRPMISNLLKMEGFQVLKWSDRWFDGISQNKKWIEGGQLIYQETITNGFENMFEAFVDMLNGGNVGKAVVKL